MLIKIYVILNYNKSEYSQMRYDRTLIKNVRFTCIVKKT